MSITTSSYMTGGQLISVTTTYNFWSSSTIDLGGGGGGGDMSIFEYSPQRLIPKNYFWVFLSNGKIVYYP